MAVDFSKSEDRKKVSGRKTGRFTSWNQCKLRFTFNGRIGQPTAEDS